LTRPERAGDALVEVRSSTALSVEEPLHGTIAEPASRRLGIIGAGNRGIGAYGAYLLRRPDLATVVAIADPREDRLLDAGAQHAVAPDRLYKTWEALLERETELDAIIIATPDKLHIEPALRP